MPLVVTEPTNNFLLVEEVNIQPESRIQIPIQGYSDLCTYVVVSSKSENYAAGDIVIAIKSCARSLDLVTDKKTFIETKHVVAKAVLQAPTT